MQVDDKIKSVCDSVIDVISPSYLVGGCVRDILLNRPINDLDFCTPLLPDDIEQKIIDSGRKCLNIGKKFGTLGMKYQSDPKIKSDIIEITSFRREAYKPGNRKPEVEFVGNITADLSRRDFTINSMALSTKDYHLTDPFNGQEDLKNKIIRCTGNPTERFKEDPLRMLRACRFASQLGFDIEEQTFKKMKEHSQLILGISKERWTIEIEKLLLGDYVGKGLRYLYESGMMVFMMPELSLQFKYDQHNSNHTLTLDNHTIKVIENLPKDINLRLAGLFHDSGKIYVQREKLTGEYGFFKHELLSAEIVERTALYYKWSNNRRELIKQLVLKHMDEDSPLREADVNAH
jgi:tRNA nucleotidyltransferase (CCA-adding enzyme)